MSDYTSDSKYDGDFASAMTHWIAVCLAVSFAAGFLILFTFFGQFSIRDTGSDFFRIRYIHVGVLFLWFPIGIAVSAILAARNRDPSPRQNNPDRRPTKFRISTATLINYIHLKCVIYAYLLFPDHSPGLKRLGYLTLLLVLSIATPKVINRIAKPGSRANRNLKFAIIIFGGLMLDWLLFEGCLKKIFIQMLGGGGIHYYLLSMLIPFVFHEGNKKADLAETPSKQRQILFMSYAVIVVLCVISAILFALKVFPYIPASKGGADFTNPVFVSVNLPDSTTLSAEQRNALSAPTSYVLIEETPESIFLAHIADAGGPLAWRQFAGVPKIVQIRKDAALIIQYHSQ